MGEMGCISSFRFALREDFQVTADNPIESFYSERFSKCEPHSSLTERLLFAQKALRIYVGRSGLKILDVGCGAGSNLIWLASAISAHSPTLHGIDVSPRAVQECQRLGIASKVLDLNVEPLPFPDRSLDVVICMEVVEHLYNTDLLIGEIARVLPPGGRMILTTPNLSSWANRVASMAGYQPFSLDVSFKKGYGRPRGYDSVNGHIKAFSRRALIEYLADFGFDVTLEAGTPAGLAEGPLLRLDRFLARFPTIASHTALSLVRR